jgi:Zn-dependent peptidase ImmA (M78 family)
MGKLDELLNEQAGSFVARRALHIGMLLRNGITQARIIEAICEDTGASAETIHSAMLELGLIRANTRQRGRRKAQQKGADGAQEITP